MSRRSIAAIVLAVAALAGCARRDAGTSRAIPVLDAGTAVDIELMAFLSEARARHHQANVREDEGDLPSAIAAIDKLVHAPRPHAGQPVPEVEEVLADAYARLAELSIRAKDFEAAERAVKEGILHAPDPTYFRGHLLEVQGITEEARASILADAGKTDEAAQARARALELLQQAVDVQEQVIGRALGDAGEGAKK